MGRDTDMGDQLFGILIVLVTLAAAVAGASYVFAMTAEREPDGERRSSSTVPR